MTARLRTHHMVVIGLGSLIAAMTACASPDAASQEADASKTIAASSVVVEARAADNSVLGSCAGTLIGPKTVLTAGHCIAGADSWSITSGSKTVKASVGSTSWKAFGSTLSHPEHSDVGLLKLDTEIKLASYPAVATKAAKDGTKGQRLHRESSSAKTLIASDVELTSGKGKGFKLNYLAEIGSKEWLDTGGAVLDSSGKIVGVVSGKGKKSGKLHITRVDNFSEWAKSAVSCATTTSVRTWGSGNPSNGGGGYGGTPIQTCNGGGGWGGWGGGGGNCAPWGSSQAPGYGGGGGGSVDDDVLDIGGTVPGSTPGGINGGGETDGETTTPPGTSTGTSTETNTCPGIPACKGDCGEGSSGLNGGTGAPTPGGVDGEVSLPPGITLPPGVTSLPPGVTVPPGSTQGPDGSIIFPDGSVLTPEGKVTHPDGSVTNPDGSVTGKDGTVTPPPSGSAEGCEGDEDNDETCPTAADSASCSGPNCGGCSGVASCVDNTIDYGSCASCTPASDPSSVVR